jgi:hypothetical protein
VDEALVRALVAWPQVAEMAEADIARVMGIRRSTVSVTLRKARANLERALADPDATVVRRRTAPAPIRTGGGRRATATREEHP